MWTKKRLLWKNIWLLLFRYATETFPTVRAILVSGNIDVISREREMEEVEEDDGYIEGRRNGEKEVYDVTTNS